MKPIALIATLIFAQGLALPLTAREVASRRADTIVLDETGVKNLRIETAVIEPGDFDETTFALGRIEVYPGRRAVVSSRIAGRVLEARIKLDHAVTKGEIAFVVESRQPGNPPPSVELTAPLGGLVGAVHAVIGEPVDPDRPLAEILDLAEVYALARVPETLAARLKPGQRAHITVAAVSGETFPAELEHLGATADPASGTVEAAFHVANPEFKLRPGMRAEFSIITAKRGDVTSVPRSALQGSSANRFVYVKDFDLPHAFVKTPVVVGESNDRLVEIVSGLFPGDEVVVRGAYSLAFAGGGTVSLKEALDAAHGHEHAADGSELKPGAGTVEGGHDHGEDHGHESPIWKILTGVFFAAFVVTLFAKKSSAQA